MHEVLKAQIPRPLRKLQKQCFHHKLKERSRNSKAASPQLLSNLQQCPTTVQTPQPKKYKQTPPEQQRWLQQKAFEQARAHSNTAKA